MKSAPDEGFFPRRQTPHPSRMSYAHSIHPLPQGERGKRPNLLTTPHDHQRSPFDIGTRVRALLARGVCGLSAAACADRDDARLLVRAAAGAVGIDAIGVGQ